MTTVLKVQNLDYRATPGDVKRVFRDNGARPADIHLGLFENGKPNGTAFVIFTDRREADNGLRIDGTVCRDSRISVRASNPKEFGRMFPGKAMLSKEKEINYNKGDRFNKDDNRSADISVVKVDHIDYTATLSDIRRFFKDHGARPADIHLVQHPVAGKHNGSAFLIFNVQSEKSNALKLDGALFRDNRLAVKPSTPKEFDRYFPRVPMMSKPKANGTGRGRGMNNNGGAISRPGSYVDDRNQDRFSGPIRGRGQGFQGGRGGGGGGLGNRVGGRVADNRFLGDRRDNMNSGRDRSRSPINHGRRDDNFRGEQIPMDRRRSDPLASNSRQLGVVNNPRSEDPLGAINERKFLRISGLPYNASQVDIQEYFRPILTRDIYINRHVGGKFAGKFNGSAIVEFFSDGDARQATKMDGSKFGHQSITVVRASKDEILRTIQENKFSNESGGPAPQPIPDITAINTIAQNNPQVQHLLSLLTATVNTIAGAASAAVTQPKPDRRENRSGRGDRNDRNRDDPVISRVASSANIDVGDIKLGRVIGLRNLPYTVTPEEILHFFRNYKVIPDSVRIHYLDDGRCSGDAIICFHGNRDARNAVTDLNKSSIGRRKVELFFL